MWSTLFKQGVSQTWIDALLLCPMHSIGCLVCKVRTDPLLPSLRHQTTIYTFLLSMSQKSFSQTYCNPYSCRPLINVYTCLLLHLDTLHNTPVVNQFCSKQAVVWEWDNMCACDNQKMPSHSNGQDDIVWLLIKSISPTSSMDPTL